MLLASTSAIKLQKSFPEELTEFMLATFDANGNGTLEADEKSELLDFLETIQDLPTQEEKLAAFKAYGGTGPDGKHFFEDTVAKVEAGVPALAGLTFDDFQVFKTRLGMSDEQLKLAWEAADKDKNGVLDADEKDYLLDHFLDGATSEDISAIDDEIQLS